MNKILSTAIFAVAALALTGCDDFLDKNRYPVDRIVNNPLYWSNPDNCQLQVNRLKQYFYGYGTGTGYGNFYFNTLTDDQCGGTFTDWKNTSVPTSSSTYNTAYTVIRGCNIMIKELAGADLTAGQRNNFTAQARMIRGWEYYQLVRMYGDVIYTEDVLDPETLFDNEAAEKLGVAKRTDRKTVMDHVYADLLYASQNITTKAAKQNFSKDMALAMLSEVCLYEGTFWKYCTLADNYYAPDAARSTQYLNRCAEHSLPLINAYPITNNYQATYNSFWSALKNNSEIILGTEYEDAVLMHSTVDYTCSSTVISGISKDAFDAYLFKDGKPLALTSLDKNDAGVAAKNVAGSELGDGLDISAVLAVRDKRLAITTDPYVYYKGMTWSRAGAMQMTSSTGYGVAKYDNINMPVNARTTAGKNYTSAPVFWSAVVCLNYAEAKAELGTLTDADMNITLNKLYARAELPNQTVASLSSMNDPANNMGVSSLLWEVRRCRRCELIMDNDFRYWDLVRWHKLDLLDSKDHPNILLGANVKNAPVQPEQKTGDYVNASMGKTRIYDARQYEYPIPSGQITLNDQLTQNKNWE